MSEVVHEQGESHAQTRYSRDGKKTVLACDGGGIRGYVTLLVLKSLMQEVASEERFENQALRHQENIVHYVSNEDPLTHLLPLPYHYFDYIVGTSTGGLIAIMLGRLRMGVKQSIAEYQRLGCRVFGKKRRFHYYKYNHRVLHDCIVEVVEKWCLDPESPRNGLDKMLHPGSTCRTIVLAVEKREGHEDQIHPFTSYAYERPEGEADLSPRSPLRPALVYIHAAAQATCAAPGFFREANVLGDLFMDGAIMANNPSRWAWKEVWDMHAARRDAANGPSLSPSSPAAEDDDRQHGSQCPIGVFVSIGTGLRAPQSAFRRGDPLKKIHALLGKAVQEMKDTEKVHKDLQDQAAKFGKKLYYRFNPEGLETMRLDECKRRNRTFRDMDDAWARYVEKPDVRRSLHECAQELVRHRRSRLSRDELLQFHDLTRLESRRSS